MEKDTCLHCSETQWSASDKKYLLIHGTCWSCDKKRWIAGEISLELFEQREQAAAIV